MIRYKLPVFFSFMERQMFAVPEKRTGGKASFVTTICNTEHGSKSDLCMQTSLLEYRRTPRGSSVGSKFKRICNPHHWYECEWGVPHFLYRQLCHTIPRCSKSSRTWDF